MSKTFTLKEVSAVAKYLNVDTKKVPLKTLKVGMNIELEHTDVTHGDPIKTAKIALAHLAEFPNYYTGLVKMENSLKKKKIKK